MSETTNLTVEEELDALKQEAEAVDAGTQLPSETAENETPTGSEEAEGESEEGLTIEDNSEDEAAGDPTEESNKEVLEDEGVSETDPLEGADVGEKSDAEPQARRTGKKKEALKRSWENADKRHREADERETHLRVRETQLLEREQQVSTIESEAPDDPLPKYSADEIASSLEEFIDDGEFDTAKNLIRSLAGKANAMGAARSSGPNSPQFAEAWDQVRGKAIKDNPELEDPKSSLYKESTGLLNGEWGPLFQAHPAGVAAAVEVAKLRMNAASSSELLEKVEQLQTENNKLKKAVALDGTTPTISGGSTEAKWDNLSLDDQLEALRHDAAILS